MPKYVVFNGELDPVTERPRQYPVPVDATPPTPPMTPGEVAGQSKFQILPGDTVLDPAKLVAPPSKYTGQPSTLKSVATEAGKGAGRGIMGTIGSLWDMVKNLPLMRGVDLANQAAALQGFAPAQAVKQQLANIQQQRAAAAAALAPKPANPMEQMVGTGAEVGTSMLPFMGAGGVIPKAANVLLPAAGAAVGQQIADEPGKFVGSLLGNVAGGLFSPRVAATNLTPQQQAISDLRDAYIKLPPSAMNGGPVARTAEYLANPSQINELARVKNAPRLQALATDSLGVSRDTPLTPEVLANLRSGLVQQGYDPVKQLGNLSVGSKFRQSLAAIENKYGGNSAFPDAKDQTLTDLLDKYRNYTTPTGEIRPLQQVNSSNIINDISNLRSRASDLFKQGNTNLGRATQSLADSIEGLVETNLQSNPAFRNMPHLLADFRNSRILLAKNRAVERMLVDPTTGLIDPTKAAAMVKPSASSTTPLTDSLKTIAEAGSPVFRKATGVPTGGGGSGLGGSPFYLGGGMFAAGSNPVLGATIASIPAIRNAARHILLSEPVQNAMARNITNPRQSQRLLNALALGMNQLPPLFSQGEQ